MIKLVLFFVIILIITYLVKNKVVIRIKSFFKKGFKLIKDSYGCYCATGKQRLSARLYL